MRAVQRGLLAVVVIGAGALAGAVAGEGTRADFSKSDKFLTRYTELLRLVRDNAPLTVGPDDLVYSSIDGMLALLDPHTNFLRPDAFANMKEHQQGTFHGIGVIISLRGGKITIITPIEGTPAARVGLRAGDTIESVDGQPTEGMDLDDAARKLRGPEGSTVRITVSRPGLPEPLELTIQRARVPTDSVRYAFMIGKDTAYIRISDFIRSTGDEVRRALERLQAAGGTRLLLDLRDNPGGTVDSAVAVSGLMLEVARRAFLPRDARPIPTRTTARHATACISRARWWCWSTEGRLRPPRSWPEPSRTTTVAWWWVRTLSARAWCRPSTPLATPAWR